MAGGSDRARDDDRLLLSGVLLLDSKAQAVALGLACGTVIFVVTNVLLLKGGDPVGPHLSLLGQYFVGYQVSFLGSLIGFGYGFGVGALAGGALAWLYNRIAILRNRVANPSPRTPDPGAHNR